MQVVADRDLEYDLGARGDMLLAEEADADEATDLVDLQRVRTPVPFPQHQRMRRGMLYKPLILKWMRCRNGGRRHLFPSRRCWDAAELLRIKTPRGQLLVAQT